MMNKTYAVKLSEVQREWRVVDADGATLGRLATQVAAILRGKHHATFTPSMDTGDPVIIVNASKIRVTGKKLQDKLYVRHSGYPGGFRSETLERLLERRPEEVIRRAERFGVLLVDLQQRAGDAVSDRADLTGHTATLDFDHRVEAARRVGHGERRGRAIDSAGEPEVLIERLAVDHDGPLTRHEAHPRDRRLAPTGPLEIRG